MSLILSVSTSSHAVSVSLVKSGSVLSEQIITNSKSHTSVLAPMIDEMFSSFAISCDDIDCYAVDIGPGSFTGVRIGVATVNGMALGSHKPVIGVNSLLALRYQHLDISPLASIIDAHNDNVYAAVYYNRTPTIPPCAVSINELIEKLPSGVLCIGDGAMAHQLLISELVPSAKFGAESSNLIKASCVGIAAWHMIEEAGSVEKAASKYILPMYLKLSQAEMKKKEEEPVDIDEEDIDEAELDDLDETKDDE